METVTPFGMAFCLPLPRNVPITAIRLRVSAGLHRPLDAIVHNPSPMKQYEAER